MARRKAEAVIILILLLGVSCRRPPVTINNEVRDSVTIREVVRFDTVTLSGDTVLVAGIVVECDSVTNRAKPLKTARRKGPAALSVTISPGGTLSASGGCDSLKGVVEIKDREISRLSSRLKTIVQPPEYRTRSIDIFCRSFTVVVLLLILGAIGLKLKGWI